ncbi:MAG: CpaF family protein [Anaerolinea sp.]|nr:CpaF family protein [Anaerolinea sp.]
MNLNELKQTLAPLEPLLADAAVTEIMIDNFDQVYVERRGRLEDVATPFQSNEQLLELMQALAAYVGRRLDAAYPMVDARLPDGSRVNMVIPPAAISGPSLVIRRFVVRPLTWEQLVQFGSVSTEIVEFLQACVRGRLNILVAGGTASGKTTVLNLISGFIPEQERVVTVENVAELNPPTTLKRLVRLESQPGIEGRPAVAMRDLVVNALRMRPDRLLIGEVRAGEVLELFQGMNTGHDGTMFTMHANSPRDALARLETMATMGNPTLPLLTIRQQMASAIHLITYQERLPDGARKITKVTEVAGMQGDNVALQDIFQFQETGREDGRIQGHYVATGYIPSFLKILQRAGQSVPLQRFTP